MGEVLGFRLTTKGGWSLANRRSLCCAHEESLDHILLHCVKARLLQKALFSLLEVC